MSSIFNAVKVAAPLTLAAAVILLTGCNATHNQATMPANGTVPQPALIQYKQSAPLTKVNCEALRRQEIYNATNANIETNDTTPAQREALRQLILKNCPSQ